MKWAYERLRATPRTATADDEATYAADVSERPPMHDGPGPDDPPGWKARLYHPLEEKLRQRVQRHGLHTVLAVASLAVTAATIALMLALKLLSGPAYTATTLIQPFQVRKETGGNAAQASTIDDKMIIDGAIQIIESHAISRNIAKKLKLDADNGSVPLTSRLVRLLTFSYPIDQATKLDFAARSLSRQLHVANPRKSHLIEVTYTASSPESAAAIANAVAGEYILFNRTTEIARRYSRAQQQFNELSARYGSRHPRVAAATVEFELARAEMSNVEQSNELLSPQELLSTGLVIPALAVSIPTNRGLGATVGFGFLLGLLVSLGMIMYFEPAVRAFVLRHIR